MDQVIIFCAEYIIFISSFLAFIFIILKSEKKEQKTKLIKIFGVAVFAWVVTHFLKDIIAHPRPDLTKALITPDSLYSFPSGHATFMFALAWGVYYLDKNSGKIIFILGAISGTARVLAGVHFWYDIIGGFIVGVLAAEIILNLIKRIR